ncbi:MAG: hypothetical protein KatS3mg082_1430 [Nitrospiraceae bacterium]|nr:MAG: hypothetical protein KatS3mg082_1430 [Nitrospiraceae bacterium]
MTTHNVSEWLEALTGIKASKWRWADGPESGVGVDYWLTAKVGGRAHTAYINIDQCHIDISVDGEQVFSGFDDELAAIVRKARAAKRKARAVKPKARKTKPVVIE